MSGRRSSRRKGTVCTPGKPKKERAAKPKKDTIRFATTSRDPRFGGATAVTYQFTVLYGADPSKLPMADEKAVCGVKPPRPAGFETQYILCDGSVWEFVGIDAYAVDSRPDVRGWRYRGNIDRKLPAVGSWDYRRELDGVLDLIYLDLTALGDERVPFDGLVYDGDEFVGVSWDLVVEIARLRMGDERFDEGELVESLRRLQRKNYVTEEVPMPAPCATPSESEASK